MACYVCLKFQFIFVLLNVEFELPLFSFVIQKEFSDLDYPAGGLADFFGLDLGCC